MPRIVITLEAEERDALVKYAQISYRDARAQAAWLICDQLRRQGYLADEQQNLSKRRKVANEGRRG